MLNNDANEIVSLVAGQLEWLWATSIGDAFYKDASLQFIINTARLANSRANSDKWKNAFCSLTELSNDLDQKIGHR